MPAYALDLTARVTLAPVILGQAVYTAKTSLKLPEPSGPRHGTTGQGQPLSLFVIGDSSAAGVGVERQSDALLGQTLAALSPDFRVSYQLHAKTGATTGQTLQRLAKLPAQSVDAAVIGLGVNDVTKGCTRGKWIAQTQELIALLTDKFGVKHICLTGLPPLSRFPLLPQPLGWVVGRQAARFDDASRQLAAGHPHVDRITFDMDLRPEMMARDGYHPGPEIYARWGQLCAARIAAHWDHTGRWMSAG